MPQPILLTRMASIHEVCEPLSDAPDTPWPAAPTQALLHSLQPGHLPEQDPLFFDRIHEYTFSSARTHVPDTFSRFGPPPFVACLSNAVVASWLMTVVDQSGCVLQELARHRPKLLAPLEAMADASGSVPVTREIEDETVLLGGPFCGAFYHWLHDFLPLLELPRPWAGRQVKYLVTPPLRFHLETLKHLGIPPEALLIHDGNAWRFRRLWVLGPRGHHMSTCVESIQWLRQMFLDPARASQALARLPMTPPKYLYLSRRDTHQRQMKNEAALLRKLEPLGFTCMDGSMFPPLDQPWLFSQARVVVGPHGGALGLTAFCPPGAQVLEFMPDDRLAFPFYNVARASHLDWYFLLCQSLGEDTGMELSPNMVGDIIESLMQK